jgi:hypothetical protein
MSGYQVMRRADDRLFKMLDEPAVWTVKGSMGQVLDVAGTLRDAVTKAQAIIDGGQHVSAVVGQGDDMVMIFRSQLDRLHALVEASSAGNAVVRRPQMTSRRS